MRWPRFSTLLVDYDYYGHYLELQRQRGIVLTAGRVSARSALADYCFLLALVGESCFRCVQVTCSLKGGGRDVISGRDAGNEQWPSE